MPKQRKPRKAKKPRVPTIMLPSIVNVTIQQATLIANYAKNEFISKLTERLSKVKREEWCTERRLDQARALKLAGCFPSISEEKLAEISFCFASLETKQGTCLFESVVDCVAGMVDGTKLDGIVSGIDYGLKRDKISVKSSNNWGNSSSKKKQVEHFQNQTDQCVLLQFGKTCVHKPEDSHITYSGEWAWKYLTGMSSFGNLLKF